MNGKLSLRTETIRNLSAKPVPPGSALKTLTGRGKD